MRLPFGVAQGAVSGVNAVKADRQREFENRQRQQLMEQRVVEQKMQQAKFQMMQQQMENTNQTQAGNRALAYNPALTQQTAGMMQMPPQSRPPGFSGSQQQGPLNPNMMQQGRASFASPGAITGAQDRILAQQRYRTPEQLELLKRMGKGPTKPGSVYTANGRVYQPQVQGDQWGNVDVGAGKPAAPLVNIKHQRESTRSTEDAKQTRLDLVESRTQRDSAIMMNNKLQIFAHSNLYTGIGGDAVQFFRQLGSALGMDTNAEEGELMKAYQSQMAMLMRNPDSGGGLPGAASEKDVEFLLSSVPSLRNTPRGRKLIANMMMAGNQMKIDRYNQMRDGYTADKNFSSLTFKMKSDRNVKAEFIAEAKSILSASQPTEQASPTLTPEEQKRYDELMGKYKE